MWKTGNVEQSVYNKVQEFSKHGSCSLPAIFYHVWVLISHENKPFPTKYLILITESIKVVSFCCCCMCLNSENWWITCLSNLAKYPQLWIRFHLVVNLWAEYAFSPLIQWELLNLCFTIPFPSSSERCSQGTETSVHFIPNTVHQKYSISEGFLSDFI